MIVAQGTEAGGHTGEISTMVLVPEVVDAVGPDVPVLAAGGIGTGRQMAAAIALGAQGAWTGSIWLTVAEANTSPESVENLLAAGSRDAIRSRSMTGKPARQLRTTWVDAWERADTPGPASRCRCRGSCSVRPRAASRGHANREFAGSPAGQIIGRIDRVRPGAEVVADMVEEWIATTERMASSAGRRLTRGELAPHRASQCNGTRHISRPRGRTCALRSTPDECEANAICCGIAPDVFELDDDDNLHLLRAEVPAGDEEQDAPRHQLLPQARPVRALKLRGH